MPPETGQTRRSQGASALRHPSPPAPAGGLLELSVFPSLTPEIIPRHTHLAVHQRSHIDHATDGICDVLCAGLGFDRDENTDAVVPAAGKRSGRYFFSVELGQIVHAAPHLLGASDVHQSNLSKSLHSYSRFMCSQAALKIEDLSRPIFANSTLPIACCADANRLLRWVQISMKNKSASPVNARRQLLIFIANRRRFAASLGLLIEGADLAREDRILDSESWVLKILNRHELIPRVSSSHIADSPSPGRSSAPMGGAVASGAKDMKHPRGQRYTAFSSVRRNVRRPTNVRDSMSPCLEF